MTGAVSLRDVMRPPQVATPTSRVTEQELIPLLRRLMLLFTSKARGNMGPEFYQNGGAELFSNLLRPDSEYQTFSGEIGLIDQHHGQISDWAKDMRTAILVGPGPVVSVESKEIPVLRGMSRLDAIIVLELSPTFNAASTACLKTTFPGAQILSFTRDFMKFNPAKNELPHGPALVMSTGSLTNYEGCQPFRFPLAQLSAHMRVFRALAGEGGKLVWGYDTRLTDDCYQSDDVKKFLLHPLLRAALLDGVTLDPTGFDYAPRIDEGASLVSHDWVVTKNQVVTFPSGASCRLFTGERLQSFCSVKLPPDHVETVGKDTGFRTDSIYRAKCGSVIHTLDCA